MATAAHTALRAAISEWKRNLKGDTLPAYVNLKDNRIVVHSRVTKSVNSLKLVIGGDDTFVIRESLQCVQKAKDELANRDNHIQLLMVTNLDVMEADSEISQVGWHDPALKWIAAAKKCIIQLVYRLQCLWHFFGSPLASSNRHGKESTRVNFISL